MDAYLSISSWTKDYVYRGPVADPSEIHGAIRWNAPGSFTFTVDADHPRIADLVAEGSRATIDYREAPGDAPYPLFSGPLTEITGKGAADVATRTFHIADDWQILNEIVGLPNPTGTMAQQGDDGAYFTSTGPAEDVLKAIVAPNATRQGVTLTVPASSALGSSITVSIRMHPLPDRLFPAVTNAGIGVRVIQIDGVRTLDVYTPTARPRVITEESGGLVDGEFSITDPTVTRVIVGAGGEGEARIFREFVDTAAEALYGVSRASFVDARDVSATDPDLEALLQARGEEALAEGAAKVNLTAVLAETGVFRFLRGYSLGDQISVRFRGSGVMTDHVREVAFDVTDQDGLVVTPLVGDWQDSSDDELYAEMAKHARGLRDLRVR